MNRMHLNLIHRVDAPSEKMNDALRFQIGESVRCGLAATHLVSMGGFRNPESLDLVKRVADEHGHETGIHFHGLDGPEFQQRFGTKEGAIYLLPREKRKAVIDHLFELFLDAFGHSPAAVGSYILDAWTLRYIKETQPQVNVAISNCFEEGVKMFQGNLKNWYLFSDGGPWGPFVPSKASALCPAHDEDEALDLVALPHLNRDMVMALVSRDDFFSSHPVNLFRARINEGKDCPYNFRFIDQWIEQAQHNNGLSYYSLFVSCPWIAKNCIFVEDFQDARSAYSETLDYLAGKVKEGSVQADTMSEFAATFRASTRPEEGQACSWKDVLRNTKRQTCWFVNSHYRAAVDMNIGGTICDLRPYASRYDTNTGPETPRKWNGNYPYILSREHRSGASHGCCVRIGDSIASIDRRRTSAETLRHKSRGTQFVVAPIRLDVGGVQVTLQSIFTFDSSGTIRIERRILACSDPEASVDVIEFFRGCWGTTEYPEDLAGIRLGFTGDPASLLYDYQGREIISPIASAAVAEIPTIRTRVELAPESTADQIRCEEGILFRPFFTLELVKKVKVGEGFASCLKISSL